MRERSFDEMIAYFNRKVSEMDIAQDYKMELLGMISAIEYKYKTSVPQWIPCSERLPDYDDYDEVITTVNGRHGDVEYINGVCTNVQYDDIDELWYINDVYEPNITVTAWMPLPQPYKEAAHE